MHSDNSNASPKEPSAHAGIFATICGLHALTSCCASVNKISKAAPVEQDEDASRQNMRIVSESQSQHRRAQSSTDVPRGAGFCNDDVCDELAGVEESCATSEYNALRTTAVTTPVGGDIAPCGRATPGNGTTKLRTLSDVPGAQQTRAVKRSRKHVDVEVRIYEVIA